jgi:tetratricopeptide (TPR) repeat protein
MIHSMQNIRRALFLSLMLALAGVAVAPNASQAADKPKGPEISRGIAKEMAAAQKALQASQWQEALKNLDAAEAKGSLTPFDKKTIYDFRGFAYIKLNKMKEAEQAFSQALATGQYSPEEAAKTTKMLFQLNASNQQYAKALEYGKQMADSGAATVNDLTIMSQIYYQQKDCKNSAIWADKAVAAARKTGEAPKENLFLFKLQCASDAQDTAAMDAAAVDLIKLTNKTTYWNTFLRIERQDERDDHNTLMIYRAMYDTNSMNAGSDYVEMAQLLGDAALPGEASMVLDKAMSTGQIKDEQKERTTRLMTALKVRADADKKGQAQFDAEATKNPAGELDVKLGEVYYGSGDYQNAVTAINRGIQKGGIKHPDEAYVYLGRAYTALKNYPEAKKAFAGLKTVPNVNPRVLKIWDLYAEKVGSPVGG